MFLVHLIPCYFPWLPKVFSSSSIQQLAIWIGSTCMLTSQALPSLWSAIILKPWGHCCVKGVMGGWTTAARAPGRHCSCVPHALASLEVCAPAQGVILFVVRLPRTRHTEELLDTSQWSERVSVSHGRRRGILTQCFFGYVCHFIV